MLNNVISLFNGIINFNWEIVKDVISAIGDTCLFFISIYTFRLTIYPKKLKFIGYSYHSSAFYGNSVEITLENRSLCPIVVRSVDLVVAHNIIKLFRGNQIIDKFRAEIIKSDSYTKILTLTGEEIKIRGNFLRTALLIIETSRGKQFIQYKDNNKFLSYFDNWKLSKYSRASVYSKKAYGKVLSDNVKYVLLFSNSNNDIHNVFILDNGMMSEDVFGYNKLSKEIVCNEKILIGFLDNEFKKHSLSYTLKKFNYLSDKLT